jgi:hypothetical protein
MNEDKKVIIRLVRDDGKEFIINGGDFRIPSDGLSGFGSLENEISKSANAFGDGDQFTSERLGSKDRTVKCKVANVNNNSILRSKAKAFFVYKHTYKMYVQYMSKNTYWCEGSLYKLQLSEGNIYKPVTLQFTLMSESPYWNSYDNFGKNIASVIPMAGFPYMSTTKGIPTGVYAYNKEVVVVNDGDIATNVKAVFRASGDVTNPKLVINNKYVRVLTHLKAEDELIIDFTPQIVRITKNGLNIIGSTDRQSDLTEMELVVGANVIGYGADNGDNNVDVSIYYNKQYGVI